MKKMFMCCVSTLLLQNIYCASGEKLTFSFPSEISDHVDRAYKNELNLIFCSLEPFARSRECLVSDRRLIYIAFSKDGPNTIIHRHPELAEQADRLQQEILADKGSPFTLLMNNSSESERDHAFWENAFVCLRNTLKSKTGCNDEIPSEGSITESFETMPFTKALVILVRFMELNYQQNPKIFEVLLRHLY
jgi:hypothetical protein